MSSQLLFVICAAFVCSLTSWTAYGLRCLPCDEVSCGPPPSCYETVPGQCGCCPECAKLEGEECRLGKCAKGLACRSSNHVTSDLLTFDGICIGPANAQCTKGEGCREYWSFETGGIVYCCPGRQRLVVSWIPGDCICNGTRGDMYPWTEKGEYVEGYTLLPTGAQCTIGEWCREHWSCKTGGTVHCCPGGERLEVNGTSGLCTCNGTGSKEFSCGGGTFGQGYELLPIKPADQDCKKNTICYGESYCSVGNTSYCCPRGHVTTVSRDGELQSCSCRYDFSGRSCTTSFASPHVTSASALTCVAASLVALLFASLMPDK